MKLSIAQRAALGRMFVMTSRKTGQRIIGNNVTTNPTVTRLSDLMALKRKGIVTYEEEPIATQVFGITMWKVLLTDVGREYLEAQP